jgi:hypothetical protein
MHYPLMNILQPLHPELYKMNPAAFFLPSFLRAIRGNTAESFMDIIHEVIAPSVYAFPMLRPVFCEMLMDEVYIIRCHGLHIYLAIPDFCNFLN